MSVRLSSFWFLYMGGMGIFFPYYSLYLRRDLELSETRVGLVVAILPLVGLFLQPAWGQLADRTGSRRGVLAAVTSGVGLANLVLWTVDDFVTALAGTALLAIFSTAVLPLATSVSMAAGPAHGEGTARFGPIRMWGTCGFLAMVFAFPHLLALEAASLVWMFPLTGLLSLAAGAVAMSLPRGQALELRSDRGELRGLMRHRPVARLVFLVFVAHCCIQGPIMLFPLYLTSRGGDVDDIGHMWIFMLLLEIPLIGFSSRSLRRLGARGLLTVGLLSEGVRWTICALSTDLHLIAIVQLLHGVGVAGILVGAPFYLEQAVPERLRSTGQALVSSAGFGAGMIVSTSLGGWLLEHVGTNLPYALAGGGALVLGLLVHRLLPEPYRPMIHREP